MRGPESFPNRENLPPEEERGTLESVPEENAEEARPPAINETAEQPAVRTERAEDDSEQNSEESDPAKEQREASPRSEIDAMAKEEAARAEQEITERLRPQLRSLQQRLRNKQAGHLGPQIIRDTIEVSNLGAPSTVADRFAAAIWIGQLHTKSEEEFFEQAKSALRDWTHAQALAASSDAVLERRRAEREQQAA